MNIALAHYRVGETDGVSLEMEKWRKVLESMGHKILFISGTSNYGEVWIPEMDLHTEKFRKLNKNAFQKLSDFSSENEFRKEVLEEAINLEKKLEKVILDKKIDILVPNNILSLGIGIPVAIAFTNVIKRYKLKTIAHHHDFYWERSYMDNPTCNFVKKCLEDYFPPRIPNIKHVVINSIARDELKRRKGLNSMIIPNVFDFNQKPWIIDEYNIDLRSKLGISENDIVFLQATRITERKAIELAIEVVGEVIKRCNELVGKLYNGKEFKPTSKIVMIMPGLIETDEKYVNFIKKIANDEGIEIKWCGSFMRAKRSESDAGKFYSLWDMYSIADMITYTSILEGWGNQFLEGIFAKKNMIVFEYPVYVRDIKPLGFKVISLGKTFNKRFDYPEYVDVPRDIIISAAKEIIRVLKSEEEYYRRVNENFELGREYFSYEVLERKLNELLSIF